MIASLFDLTGRVALVSGAGRGMGRSSALALAEAGADLVICDRDSDTLHDTAAEMTDLGRRVVPVVCDITDVAQVRAMFERLDESFGRIDILMNIPGSNHPVPPEQLTVEAFRQRVAGILVSKFCSCQEAGRRMLSQGKGSIVNMCSIAGVSALGRGNFAYSVAMGGVAQMTRELSTEWSGRGVRVNAILPSQIANPGLEARMAQDPPLRDTFLRGIPLGRLGVTDDIRGLAIFLASDASSFITGALIPLDGGNLAKNAGGSHTVAGS